MLKNMFFLQKEKNFFSIKKEKDFYYLVSLKSSEFAFTRTKSDAESLVNEMNILTKWNDFNSINDLHEKDLSEYKRILPTIKKYAVKVVTNGNYRNHWKESGELQYRINFGQLVSAQEEVAPGVGLRTDGKKYFIDLIFLGKKYKDFDTESKARIFVEKTQDWIPWHDENVLKIISDNSKVTKFLKNLELEIEKDLPITEPSLDIVTEISFGNLGENAKEKIKVYQETINKLNKMVGLKQIKEYTQNMFRMIVAEKKLQALNIGSSNTEMHSIFVGPPGTGKTEVARMFGDILWSLNKIPERKVIEVSKEDFVSQYIGETEVKTKEVIERAKGGILFVDEAYTLVDTKSEKDYGKIALEVIMRAMENERGNLVVIFAGYENDIEKLMDVNDGLRSRFSQKFYFEDYTVDELVDIAHKMIIDNGFESLEADKELKEVVKTKYKNGHMSGNARSIRKLVADIITNHKLRIVDNKGDFYKIDPEDVSMVIRRKDTRNQETIVKMRDQAFAKLDALVGLSQLKDEVKKWSNFIKVEKKRAEMKLSSNKISYHMTFKGSPGTGKTTVARIMGEILKSNGILSRGHFKEVNRSDLVGEYVGHTAIKVKKLLKEIEGGVLFIDEAYSLVQDEKDSFGKEAVDILIAEMENKREDLVVILAGYTNEIDKLLETNPGFRSRISNHFIFPDYNADELVELLRMSLKEQRLVLTSSAEIKVIQYIENQHKNNQVDGNGRWVREFIDKLKKNQANRIAEYDEITEESLMTIEVEDILY